MLGAEHTSCQSPIWGFPSFPWFFKIFHFYLFLLPEIWLVRIRKTTKPVSKKFSDYCCYFSFIDYWCNYVNQSIQSTGPSYSDTSTRTRTGTDSKILTIEPDNLMDNNKERLRARTTPWFFGHFWKSSEVVVNYFWTLSKMAEKSRGRSCSEPSNYSCLTKIFCMNWCNNNQTLF